MKKIKKLGLAGEMLTLALLLGGCGAHAGFRIGKSPTPTMGHVNRTTMAQVLAE